MFELIESNGEEIKEVFSNNRTIWRSKELSIDKTGADLGLNQNDLIYSGMATIRVGGNSMSISLGRQDYNMIRKRRIIVIYGKKHNINTMGVSNINDNVSLIGSRNANFSMKSLFANVSLRNTKSVGRNLISAKDIEAYIEIYQ